jgi:DNA-binding NarL/FixJ family response regulator
MLGTATQVEASALSRPRVLIADDHRLILEGLQRIISDRCDIVGTSTTGKDLVERAAELKPEFILLDIAMPLLNGIEAARQIKRVSPDTKLIFVTMQVNRDYVREAFKAGASGYVLKQSAASELLDAIADVRRGRLFVSPMIAERFFGTQFPVDQNPLKLFSELTPRQREVLQRVAEGKSAKEIAATLYISVKTVEFHKKHLMQELNLRSTPELIRYAVEQGWVAS